MENIIRIENENAEILKESLKHLFDSDDRSNVVFRVKNNHKTNINLLVINIFAQDLTTLRATVNTILRILTMYDNIEKEVKI
ncbi:hypothetical protein KO465_02815 [Candidatus Micrarchaeota archaeon]|nr:hypothetical protein [Candidatus Micrarchaeota archaeon]